LAGPGVVGEIVVRGPTVSPGYFNNPIATTESFKDGWLYTGDIGYLDGEGFLYTMDRRKDLIVSGGENVYPAEIEAVLMSHPGVKDTGVVGRDDPMWGQVPVAFLVKTGEEVSTDDLKSFCRAHLAGYKIPK
jgi:o-succinylbenzoate---CoA ligase